MNFETEIPEYFANESKDECCPFEMSQLLEKPEFDIPRNLLSASKCVFVRRVSTFKSFNIQLTVSTCENP